jgi:hypothetical protein
MSLSQGERGWEELDNRFAYPSPFGRGPIKEKYASRKYLGEG